MSNKTKAKKEKARKEKLRQQKHQDRIKNAKNKMKPGKYKLSQPAEVTQEMFSDEQYRFWLAHGVNYLVSDYDNGLWEPMFPTIYEGGTVDSEMMATAITKKFAPLADKDKHWPKAGRTAMSWSLITREVVYIYYREALRRQKMVMKNMKTTDTSTENLSVEELVVSPGNPAVWEVFKYMLDGVKE